MIRRIVIMWRKELAQHALAVVGICVLLGFIGLVTWAAMLEDPLTTSQLDAGNRVLLGFVPIAALILGHLIVVREYHLRTQLFIEALPMRRWEFVLAKYTLGWAVLGGLTLLLLATVALAAGGSDGKHLWVLSLRAFGYVSAWWSGFFALGLLGRLRVPVYVGIAIALYALETTTAFEIRRFGPIELIDPSTFTYEREFVPWRALVESGLLAAGFLALAVGLSLVREGSVAETLARKASQREKSALLVLGVLALMVVAVVDDKKERRPFEFTSSAVRRSAHADIEVMYGWPELEPHGVFTVRQLEILTQRLERELGVERRPPIRVAHKSALDADEVRTQHLPDADGVLLEANLGTQAFDVANLLSTATHASFLWTTQGRASFEPEHWLLDGFSSFWVAEQIPSERRRLWLAGLVAARTVDVSAAEIAAWERVMQTTGERLASALAATGIFVLAERHGRRAVLELARARLAKPARNDFVGWLRARKLRLAEQFVAVTGEPWPEFVRAWQAELVRRSAEREFAETLHGIEAPKAALHVQAGRAGAEIVYELSGAPPEVDLRCALLHGETQPYDLFVDSESLTREEVSWAAGKNELRGALRGRYGRGQRVFAALECILPELKAPVRLRVLRQTVP